MFVDEPDTDVNAYDHLKALGFSDIDAVAIVLRVVIHHLSIDIDTLKQCAAELGYEFPVATTFSLGPDNFRNRN